MKKFILHIGFSKTGSSALQADLCQNQQVSAADGPALYVVVRKGCVLKGATLAQKARRHPLGYIATDASLAEAVKLAGADAQYAQTTILSQESWGHKQFMLPALEAALQNLEAQAEIVAYIRPQTDWFRSAWWQWYAWEKPQRTPAEIWAQLVRSGYADWAAHLGAFQALPSISKVTVKLFDPAKGIARSFRETLGEAARAPEMAPVQKTNLSLSPIHIKIYKAIPWLRRPHGGTIDGIVTRLIKSSEPPPNIISDDLAATIIENMKTGNEKLLNWLSPEEAATMKNDPRWWQMPDRSAAE